MTAFAFSVLPIIPLIAWLLLVGWSPDDTEGEVLLQVPVPVLARLKMLAIPLALGILALLAGVILGHTHWWLIVPFLAIYAGVLSIHIDYTLTSLGIRTGKGAFRRWTEFAGVRRSPSGAILQGGQHARSYPIFLSGERDDDDFVLTLKNLVRDSYQGRATEAERLLGERSQHQAGGNTKTTSSINH